jgi:hypothetical protein
MTEPLKVMAPMAAPSASSSRLPPGWRVALGHDAEGPGLGHRRHGDEHRRQADHAVHEGHQLGHLGHLDALGHDGAAPPPTSRPSSTQPSRWPSPSRRA